jgi:hypothetical protein
MSYSIQEGAEDARKRQEALEAIAEKYPDAWLDTLDDGRKVWMSNKVEPTDFEIVPSERTGGHIVKYTAVQEMRVYMAHGTHTHLGYFFGTLLKKEHPDVYKQLLEALR